MSALVVQALSRYMPEDHVDTAVQLLDERQLDKLAMMVGEIQSITDAVTSKPIETDGEEGKAAELLARGAAAEKELEALRRSRVDPLNSEVRAVNALFKVLTDPLSALCGKARDGGKLERMIVVYRQVKQARIQREQDEARRIQREAAYREQEALIAAEAAKNAEERAAALAAADKASREQAVAVLSEPMDAPKGVRTDSGSLSASERYVVQGITDLALVPTKFWHHEKVVEALTKVLQAAVRAGEREIPGVAIGVEDGLTVRPGR